MPVSETSGEEKLPIDCVALDEILFADAVPLIEDDIPLPPMPLVLMPLSVVEEQVGPFPYTSTGGNQNDLLYGYL